MNKNELRLDYLTDIFIEQEIYLLDCFLSRIPYFPNKPVEIEMKDISKDIFLKTNHDWLSRIMEILDRFMKLGIISNYQGPVTADCDENTLIKYRGLLLEEQKKRKSNPNDKLFAWIKNKALYIKTNQENEPLTLTFKDDSRKHSTFSFLVVLYEYWKDMFYRGQLDNKYRCTMPRSYLIEAMKKEGFDEFSPKLNDTKTNLEKKLNNNPLVGNQVSISYDGNDSLIFGILPVV